MENTHRQKNDEPEDILRDFSESAPETDPTPSENTPPPPKKKGKAGQKVLFYGLLGIFAAIFLFSAVYLAHHLILQHRDDAQYDNLSNIVANIQGRPTNPEPTLDPTDTAPPFVGSTDPAPTEPVILPEYLPIYEMNQDTVGWIKIENTNINYPVLQTKDKKDYYIDHNFNKQQSYIGAIYVRELCDVFKPSDNVVIYGHRIAGGQMFSQLQHYTSKSFWQDHPYITFDTLYEHHTYQIFAVFKTSGYSNMGYPFHRFNDALDQADFDNFIADVKGLSFYNTGITPQYGDKLITLCTCEYTLDNGRLVVVAVQVS